jgi:hypothetical protein
MGKKDEENKINTEVGKIKGEGKNDKENKQP